MEFVFEMHELCELGWKLNYKYWNNGYATEAIEAIIPYIFNETNVNRIEVCVWKGNKASERVVEKLGLTYEGVARQARIRHDFIDKGSKENFDVSIFSVIRTDKILTKTTL